MDLSTTLPLQTQGELAALHGIDSTLFVPETLHIGPAPQFRDGLEAWANKKAAQTTHGQLGTRAGHQQYIREALAIAEGGWSVFSVKVNQQGWPVPGEAFLGHRIHPRQRRPGKLKFNATGRDTVNRGIMLPPFSYKGAQDLLDHHGFSMPEDDYLPWKAWKFIFKTPTIPVWIEESALKAMAACSIGQIAIGLNGINGAGQPGRSDRLHPALKRLARHGRPIRVRFDRPEKATSKSEQEARKLAGKLKKEGAQAGWMCWPAGMPAKTDDVIAALSKQQLSPEQRAWLDIKVTTAVGRGDYRRIRQEWPGELLEREFQADDVIQASMRSRVVVLKGATGTAKSTAMVGAVEVLEQQLGQKVTVLGAYHRASLVHKGSAEFGVADLSAERGTAEREGLHPGRVQRDGLFCCGESAYKESDEMTLWTWYWRLKEQPRPTVLVLDEISQVLSNWTMGGTEALRRIRGKALTALEGLIQLDCVKVWAADALVGDVELQWLKGLTGHPPVLIRSSYVRQRPLYMAPPSREAELTLLRSLEAVASTSGRFWLGCGTRGRVRRLMDALPKPAEGTELRITRKDDSRQDPRVTRLMADTETEGPAYQRVGFSPALSCGISMAGTEVDLAAVVQEYKWQAEDVVQALNRARRAKTRILIAPAAVPEVVGITKETTAERAALVLKETMEAGEVKDYASLLKERHPATRRAVAELEARRNLEAFTNEWVLSGLLAEEGYEIRPLTSLSMTGGEGSEEQGGTSAEKEKEIERLQSVDGPKQYRQAALQRLALGNSTIERERIQAKRLAEGGTFIDLATIDVSEAWAVAQELRLDALARAGIVHANSPEVKAVWEQLTQLNMDGAKRVSRAFEVRPSRVPGPMDKLDVRQIWPILKRIGFESGKPVGGTRADGKRWEITPIQLDPPEP